MNEPKAVIGVGETERLILEGSHLDIGDSDVQIIATLLGFRDDIDCYIQIVI